MQVCLNECITKSFSCAKPSFFLTIRQECSTAFIFCGNGLGKFLLRCKIDLTSLNIGTNLSSPVFVSTKCKNPSSRTLSQVKLNNSLTRQPVKIRQCQSQLIISVSRSCCVQQLVLKFITNYKLSLIVFSFVFY